MNKKEAGEQIPKEEIITGQKIKAKIGQIAKEAKNSSLWKCIKDDESNLDGFAKEQFLLFGHLVAEYSCWNGGLMNCKLFGSMDVNRVYKDISLVFSDEGVIDQIYYWEQGKNQEPIYLMDRKKLEKIAEAFGL